MILPPSGWAEVLTVEGGGHGDPLPGVHPPVQHQTRGVPPQGAPANLHSEYGSVLVTPAELKQLRTEGWGPVFSVAIKQCHRAIPPPQRKVIGPIGMVVAVKLIGGSGS